MLSQLGYVCLFSSAFPLAAMAALLGNLLELRGDAFKLCFVLQRPFGRRVSNIGTWQVSEEQSSKAYAHRHINLRLNSTRENNRKRFTELFTVHFIFFMNYIKFFIVLVVVHPPLQKVLKIIFFHLIKF